MFPSSVSPRQGAEVLLQCQFELSRVTRLGPSRLRRLTADLELRSGVDSIPTWADYPIGFFSEVFPNRKANASECYLTLTVFLLLTAHVQHHYYCRHIHHQFRHHLLSYKCGRHQHHQLSPSPPKPSHRTARDKMVLSETECPMQYDAVLRHVIRMDEKRIADSKRSFTQQIRGKRIVGKPRKRWEDKVRKGAVNILGIRAWKTKARDRQYWKRHIEEAKAQIGL
ncbi:hypothetical protein ANN_08351 [Periplaneta americana]|uniref:Uncharacterized protein n=1 Tax=Periplaneta americana TaxID=6978 RepID=A0ABQ8T2P6_PERAM|nr:hypothetical protein ANN_08351 [Periplaneta americana]